MKRINTIPTILGIIILLVGTFAGVFFLNMTQVFRIGADANSAPQDVRVSNITDSSVTVSWTTAKETVGFVNWGNSTSSINKIEKENGLKFFNHSVNLSGLSPKTAYYFKINSDGTNFDNNSVPWQFTTGAQLNSVQNSLPVSGSVITASGIPSKRAIVYMTVDGYLMSTLTSDSGNYVFQLNGARTTDLTKYSIIDKTKTLLEISVVGGPTEVSSAKIFPQSASPIPPIVFGQVYDHRNLAPNTDGQTPDVNLNLPENQTSESKFNIASSSATPSSTSVILESITDGETITSDKPQFFGKGPGGETITITVHSENPVTESVTIPKNGSWSWAVPTNLAAGAHTITVSWIDTTGITRQLTRNFVVQASELPAFVASSSATPTATGSGTATPKSTSTPKPTATASSQPIPTTGSLTPTILLSIMGMVVMLFSFIIFKIAEN